MKCVFLFCLILPASTGDSHLSYIKDWHDVKVARVRELTVLACRGLKGKGDFTVNWLFRSLNEKVWKLVLSTNKLTEFSGVAAKHTMMMNDANFQNSKDFSLRFMSMEGDEGVYTCVVKRLNRTVKEKVILLQLLTVTVNPANPVPQCSTLVLITDIRPNIGVSQVTWTSPSGLTIRSETDLSGTTAKLPWVEMSDAGLYVCSVLLNSTKTFVLIVSVDIDEHNVVSYEDVENDEEFCQVAVYQTPFDLHCPGITGDYVYLYWQPPDTTGKNFMKKVFRYDRWRKHVSFEKERLQLAGPPHDAEAGRFSFLLQPELVDGGIYMCEVFLNDRAYRRTTTLSVLKVISKPTPTKLNLFCLYSERSQVQLVRWEHQNTSHKLQMFSVPGKVQIAIQLPVSPANAGNYTCTVVLKNKKSASVTHIVTLPPKEGARPTPSLPSFLYALLLLPLVAAAVGVLLWRRKHVSNRGIEQSLSVHSGEAENVYENPEDIRQAAPPSPVYMDLKPRAKDDVYKELER